MSTIKVNKIENTSTTAGGVAIDSSGHVQVDGLQMPTAGALSNRNKIINGAMTIDQRNSGASVTPADGNYTLDRWNAGLTQSSKFSVQQSTVAPTGFSNSLLVTSLSAYSVVAGDLFRVSQLIEGFNFSDLAWGTASAKTVTLSFWVRSSLTGTFGGSFVNSADNRSYPFTYSISALEANTWVKREITIPGDTTGTWVGATNGIGLRVHFSLGAGSTFSGTAGSWAGSLFTSATGATSVVGTSGATLYITGVQLEVGEKATPYEHRSYGDELARCQRYYQKIGGSSFDTSLGLGAGYSTTALNIYVHLPVTLRTKPSVDTTGSLNWLYYGYGASTASVNNAPSVGDNGDTNLNTLRLYITSLSSITAGGSYWCLVNGNHSLTISAEL